MTPNNIGCGKLLPVVYGEMFVTHCGEIIHLERRLCPSCQAAKSTDKMSEDKIMSDTSASFLNECPHCHKKTEWKQIECEYPIFECKSCKGRVFSD